MPKFTTQDVEFVLAAVIAPDTSVLFVVIVPAPAQAPAVGGTLVIIFRCPFARIVRPLVAPRTTSLEPPPMLTALVVVPVPILVTALLLALMFVVPVTVFVPPATVTVFALLPMETAALVVPVPMFVAALLLALMFVAPLIVFDPVIVFVPPAMATVFALLPMLTVLVVVPVPMFVAALLLALMLVAPVIVFVPPVSVVLPETARPVSVPRLVSEEPVMPEGSAVPVRTLAGTAVRFAPDVPEAMALAVTVPDPVGPSEPPIKSALL